MEGRNNQKCIVSHADASLMVKDVSKALSFHLVHVLRCSLLCQCICVVEAVGAVANGGDSDEDEEERSSVAD